MNDTSLPKTDEISELVEADPNPAAPPAGKASGLILWISGFALLASLALLVGGFWLWAQYQDLLNKQQQVASHSSRAMLDLQQNLTSLNSRMETGVIAKVEAIKAEQADMAEQQQHLRQSVNAVKALAAPEQQGWALAEAAYLMRVANHRLIFLDDPDTAIEALQAADQRLQQLDDPATLEVRTILAWEISSLKALSRPDIEGMALILSSLAKLAAYLPLPGPESLASPPAPASLTPAPLAKASGETDRNWQQAMDKVWTDVRKLVVVRKKGESRQEILTPKESYFLRENLSLKLHAARINLLQRSAKAYQQDLTSSREWVVAYFLQDSPEVRHLLLELERLASIDIASKKPDISSSLRQITLLQAHLAGKEDGERLVEQMKAASRQAGQSGPSGDKQAEGSPSQEAKDQ